MKSFSVVEPPCYVQAGTILYKSRSKRPEASPHTPHLPVRSFLSMPIRVYTYHAHSSLHTLAFLMCPFLFALVTPMQTQCSCLLICQINGVP